MANKLNIIIAGDIHLGGGRVEEWAKKGSAKKILGKYLSYFQSSDVSIGNLESPLINQGKKILKTGPNLKSSIETVRFLADAGMHTVTLANNHIMDYGPEGLMNTISLCNSNGIKTVGAGRNSEEAKKTLFIERNNIKTAIINIAENEFGTSIDNSAGAHPMNLVDNFYTIKTASESSDYVIVIVHGGHEHYHLPSPRMKKTYRFFIDSGADFVAGHHPHCISGYETYNSGQIFYSLGNFIFDKKSMIHEESWCRGLLLELNLDKNSSEYELIPFMQNEENVGLRALTEKELKKYESDIILFNSIIADDELLGKQFDIFCKNSKRLYNALLEPHSFRLLHFLRNRGMFPSLLSKKKKRLLLNLIRCEAHKDIVQKVLSE